jgi:CRP-like cAMP-binding protein
VASRLVELKDRAARAMIKGDWRKAVEVLEQAAELAPRDAHVALKLGDMHQRLGDETAAVDAYRRAAALFAAAGFMVKAISVNKLILSLDPSDRRVQDALAELLSQQRVEQGLEESAAGSDADPPPATRALDLPEIELARIDPARLPRTPLLSDLAADEVEAVIEQLVVTTAAAGTVLCREGEPADSMYIIVHGTVQVSARDAQGRPRWLTNLREGAFFGEFGLLSDGRRHADVIAGEDCELLQIGRDQLDALIERHPRLQQVLLRFYKERVVDTVLATSPLTRSLGPAQRAALLEQAALEIHRDGSMIIQEGDDGLHLFVIKGGEVEVATGLGDQRIELARLGPGDIFGEISTLTGTPATADVVARGPVELIKFSRREVIAMARRHPQLAHQLAATKAERIHETVERIQVEGFV